MGLNRLCGGSWLIPSAPKLFEMRKQKTYFSFTPGLVHSSNLSETLANPDLGDF